MKLKMFLMILSIFISKVVLANPVVPNFIIKNKANHIITFKIINLLPQNQILQQFATKLFGAGSYGTLVFTPNETIILNPGQSKSFTNPMSNIVNWFATLNGATPANEQTFYRFAAI